MIFRNAFVMCVMFGAIVVSSAYAKGVSRISNTVEASRIKAGSIERVDIKAGTSNVKHCKMGEAHRVDAQEFQTNCICPAGTRYRGQRPVTVTSGSGATAMITAYSCGGK